MVVALRRHCELREEAIRRAAGLTPAAYQCLSSLRPGEEHTLGQLAERLGLSPSRCSRVVADLLAGRYIQRRPGQGDRRALCLSLAARGRQVHRAIARALMACERAIVKEFAPSELARVKAGLAAIIQRL